jgi:hypothetical protein
MQHSGMPDLQLNQAAIMRRTTTGQAMTANHFGGAADTRREKADAARKPTGIILNTATQAMLLQFSIQSITLCMSRRPISARRCALHHPVVWD